MRREEKGDEVQYQGNEKGTGVVSRNAPRPLCFSQVIACFAKLTAWRFGTWAGRIRAEQGTPLQGYGLHSRADTQGDAGWDEDVPGPLCPGLC